MSLEVVCEGSCERKVKTVNPSHDVVFRNDDGDFEVDECPTCGDDAHLKAEDEDVEDSESSEDEDDGSEQVSVDVDSREDLEELSWEDLKDVARDYNVKITSREEVTEGLVEAIGL